jgi:Na+/proline symporter
MPLAQVEVSQTGAWLIIIGFFVVWVLIGAVLKRRVVTEEDSLLAGRGVGDALGIMTVMAAWITTGTILGTSEFAFGFGIIGIVAIMAAGGPAMIYFAILARRIRILMPNGRTVGDFFRLRFDKKNYYLFLPMTLLWDVGFMLSLALGAGIVLETLFEIPYHLGVLATLSVCVVYVALAQMVSVIANDWLQGMLLLTMLVGITTYILTQTGVADLYTSTRGENEALVSFENGPGLLAVGALMMYGVGSVFMDNLWWSRAWAIRRPKKVFILAGLGWMTVALVSGVTAFVVFHEGIAINQPNEVFPKAMLEFLPTGGALAAVLIVYIAVASSLGAILWASASLILVDGYKQFVNPTPSKGQLQRVGVAVVLVLGVIVFFGVWSQPLTVQTLLVLFGVVTGSYLFPVTMGLYWGRTNRMGTFLGVIVGVATGVIMYYGISKDFLYQAVITSSLVSGAFVFAFTLIRPEHFDWRQLREAPVEEAVAATGR